MQAVSTCRVCVAIKDGDICECDQDGSINVFETVFA